VGLASALRMQSVGEPRAGRAATCSRLPYGVAWVTHRGCSCVYVEDPLGCGAGAACPGGDVVHRGRQRRAGRV